MTEPAWEPDSDVAGVWRPISPGRTPAEEQVLTDFARNYMTGRRWLCRVVHACVGLGIMIGALAAGWDHLTAGLERATTLLTHSR